LVSQHVVLTPSQRTNKLRMRHSHNQVDPKTKANARANPYMIILSDGTTTTSAPPDVVLVLALNVVRNDRLALGVVGNDKLALGVGKANAFKHPIDVVIVVFVPFLATTPLNGSPKQCALSDVGFAYEELLADCRR